MTFFRDKVWQSIQSAGPKVRRFEGDQQATLVQARHRFEQALKLGPEEIARRLKSNHAPGALLTSEWENQSIIRFEQKFRNHAEAREWAYAKLLDQVTFCADGSQIMPDRSFSIPIAAVQVGWFANYHRADGHYEKDARFEVLTPQLLQGQDGVSEQAVNLRRYQLENEAAIEFIRRKLVPRPLVYVDGSLILSFAQKFTDASDYIQCLLALLDEAEATETPMIGYIDSSYAHDILDMLCALYNTPFERITDARLLEDKLQWGDRTPACLCAREGILDCYGHHKRGIGFTYLKTNTGLPPVRLEFPYWMVENGILPHVIDLIRAEAIVGNGYPYTIETADATAVLGGGDREVFHRLFQEYATQQGLPIHISSKAQSKSRRRR